MRTNFHSTTLQAKARSRAGAHGNSSAYTTGEKLSETVYGKSRECVLTFTRLPFANGNSSAYTADMISGYYGNP